MEKLKKRWGITSNYQLVIIFVVFAITGSTAAKISNWMMEILGIYEKDIHWFLYYLLLIVLFILMVFGYLFGQSKFFFPFSKKILRSMGMGFVFNDKKD
jgi:hypothetical protein